MKISIKITAAFLVSSLLALSAQATVVFQDNFNYPNGSGEPPGTLTNAFWVSGAGNSLNTGVSVINSNAVISTANASAPRAYFTNGLAGFSYPPGSIWIQTNLNSYQQTAYYFGTNTPVAAVYFSYTLNVSAPGQGYFCDLCDTNFTLVTRTYAATNTVSTAGDYRIGVATGTTLSTSTNSSGVATNVVQQDLSLGTTYTVVGRFILDSGLETVWVNPVNEASAGSANITFTAPWPRIAGFAFRAASSSDPAACQVSNLIVGTTFADVIPSSAGSNPPFITVQPQSNTNLFAGGNQTNSVVAGGDPSSYQWYFVSNSVTYAVAGATSASLALNNVATNQSGQYYVVLTNLENPSEVITSSMATLLISPSPIPPTITTQPVGSTNSVGDTVTFSVVASGIPVPSYQWFFVNSNTVPPTTNFVVGPTNIAPTTIGGTNTATLTITDVTNTQAGYYFVTISNFVAKTNSALVPLVVLPPPILTIGQLRSTNLSSTYQATNTISLFTVTGIVTTWTNLTTSGNSEFCIQDSSGGIDVYWDGAPASTNLPPAGALVRVTGAVESFDGLLELEPVFSDKEEGVTILSTGNPLPTPQPLPFDPNVVNNTAQMFALGSTYFVASNVTLEAAPPTYTSEANEPLTNNFYHVLSDPILDGTSFNPDFTNQPGQTFVIYYNENANFLGTTKPTGPVTIYGVLGFYSTANGDAVVPSGWEFTPTRGADIITYVNVTNVLTHLIRQGDMVTNSFNQSVLRPGESLTTYVSIADPEGGSVTLTPSYTGLPADANWSTPVDGQTATAVFTFNPTTADQSSNYVVNLGVSSTSGNDYTYTFTVYVPTPDEQNVYISEIFAKPATNTASPAYNPLKRGNGDFGVETNIPVDDQYIEIANISPDPVSLYGGFFNWSLGNGQSTLHVFDNTASSGTIEPSSAYVVYGGPDASTSDPSEPTILGGYPNGSGGQIEPVDKGESLGLSINGGVIALYDQNGYLVDRVVYPASALNTSFSRFPTLNSGMVPQAYISTNYTTAGLQYDGGAWNAPTKVPAGVTNVVISERGTNAVFAFPVNTPQAYTLWNSGSLYGPWNVLYGQGPLINPGTGMFTNSIAGPVQFYFMTTQ